MADKITDDSYFVTECSVVRGQLTDCRRVGAVLGRRGFTLVELIVVTAVLGVLAMMALPSYNGYIQTVKNGACISDIRTIDKAIQAYILDKNTLPASLSDVGMDTQLDPWKRPFVYKNLGDADAVPLKVIGGVSFNLDYDLYSKGEDGASSPASGNPENNDDIVRANDGSAVEVRP